MAESNTKDVGKTGGPVPRATDALSTAWNSEVERTCQTALATAWQLLHETAYDLGVRAFDTPEGEARTALLEAARKVKAKSDWIYWTGRSADAGAPPWHDAWLKALLGMLEYKEHLPPDSGRELQEIFAATYDDFYRRHYWWRKVESAIGKSIDEFFPGVMSPTTFRKWLNGGDVGDHRWKAVVAKLRAELPAEKHYLLNEMDFALRPVDVK